jgi:ATP-dependent DNA helicase RecG
VENIRGCGSKARNPLIARALFDFPVRPNIDAGEGVRMMFSEMERAGLYPPLYRESSSAAGESVVVTLMSDPKSRLWDLVSEWIDRNGPIGNAQVRTLGGLDRSKASRFLKRWEQLGFLQPLQGRGRRNTAYRKVNATTNSDGLFAEPSAHNRASKK